MRRFTLCAALALSSALRPALPRRRGRTLLGDFNARPRCRALRAVDDEAQTAYNPSTDILETKK